MFVTYILNLMPEESINGFFIRDAIVNHTQNVKNKEVWVYGFLGFFRLYTKITGSFVDRYFNHLQQINPAILNSEHTLYPLFYSLTGDQININDGEINLYPRNVHNTEIKSVPVRACPKCCQEQIENHGFYWLKASWQNPYCLYCFEHNQSLVSVIPVIEAQYYASELTEKSNIDNIDEWFTESQEVKPLCSDTISLYRWFDLLKKANLPHLSHELIKEILTIVFYKIYGTKKADREEIVTGLWECFERFITGDSRHKKWFFHGNHNERVLKKAFNNPYHYGISTAQFWTIVYLGFKDFDFFYSSYSDILLS